jgi:hypothetical protein
MFNPWETIRPKRKGAPRNRKHKWIRQHVYDAACSYFNYDLTPAMLVKVVKSLKKHPDTVVSLTLPVYARDILWIGEEIMKERRKQGVK